MLGTFEAPLDGQMTRRSVLSQIIWVADDRGPPERGRGGGSRAPGVIGGIWTGSSHVRASGAFSRCFFTPSLRKGPPGGPVYISRERKRGS